MPDEPNFATQVAPAIKDFHIESARFIIGEGVPRIEFVLGHLIAPHKIVLKIIPSTEAFTEGSGEGGVVKMTITASPRLRINMTNMETKEEVKL